MVNQILMQGITPAELVNLVSEKVTENVKQHINGTAPYENTKEILSRKDVAELFGVSLVCVHDWMNKKILKHYKLGNKTYFYKKEVLETLFNSNRA